jgi:hypothetical protein
VIRLPSKKLPSSVPQAANFLQPPSSPRSRSVPVLSRLAGRSYNDRVPRIKAPGWLDRESKARAKLTGLRARWAVRSPARDRLPAWTDLLGLLTAILGAIAGGKAPLVLLDIARERRAYASDIEVPGGQVGLSYPADSASHPCEEPDQEGGTIVRKP